MNEPRVYQHSVVTQIFVFVLLFLMMGGACFAFGFAVQTLWLVIPFFTLLAFLFVYSVIAYTSKTIISEQEITTRVLFSTKTLRWPEIARASGRGYGLKLHNFDEDVTLSLNSQLPGYEEVIDFIGRKRPDLFSPHEHSEMRRGFGQVIGGLLGLALLLGVGGVFFWTEPSSDDFTAVAVPLIFLGVIFLVIVVSMFSVPQSINLEGGTLRMKYAFGEKVLNAGEIASVNYWYTRTRNGKRYFIALTGVDKKITRISGLSLSLPIAYLTIRNWHAQNT